MPSPKHESSNEMPFIKYIENINKRNKEVINIAKEKQMKYDKWYAEF